MDGHLGDGYHVLFEHSNIYFIEYFLNHSIYVSFTNNIKQYKQYLNLVRSWITFNVRRGQTAYFDLWWLILIGRYLFYILSQRVKKKWLTMTVEHRESESNIIQNSVISPRQQKREFVYGV